MSNSELIFKIIEILLQLALVVLAYRALSTWKKELRGKDRYKRAKELLEYIKELRFRIYTKTGSMHQIYLNDILTEKEKFYEKQLSLINKEDVYFNQSVFGLFGHINVRGDIFLPKQIRIILEELYPVSGKQISVDKNKNTYIEIFGVKQAGITSVDGDNNSMDGVYQINNIRLTIEEYFKKWEKLMVELQKII